MKKNELKFSRNHIWVRVCGDTAQIGISGYAQEKLGTVMFVNLPDQGCTLDIGEKFGDVESVKTVSELYSPAVGRVEEVNETLLDEPDIINNKPYEAWLICIKPVEFDPDLMDWLQYEKYVKSL